VEEDEENVNLRDLLAAENAEDDSNGEDEFEHD